jgi:hypothetical protein
VPRLSPAGRAKDSVRHLMEIVLHGSPRSSSTAGALANDTCLWGPEGPYCWSASEWRTTRRVSRCSCYEFTRTRAGVTPLRLSHSEIYGSKRADGWPTRTPQTPARLSLADGRRGRLRIGRHLRAGTDVRSDVRRPLERAFYAGARSTVFGRDTPGPATRARAGGNRIARRRSPSARAPRRHSRIGRDAYRREVRRAFAPSRRARRTFAPGTRRGARSPRD